MDSRVSKFCSKTGAQSKEAREFLQSFSGDLENAINAYNILSRVPEAGPQKNQKQQQQQQQQQQQMTSAGSPPLSPQAMQRKYLKRGLSKTTENIRLVNQMREQQAADIIVEEEEECVETPVYTFILPDLTVYPDPDFRAFLHKELIETSTLVSLEHAGRLNWWSDLSVCQRLLPLATTGDGNCLLHAASLGMWGFHDRLLTLRKTLFAALTHGTNKASLVRRWRWHQTQINKQSGLILSEEEWAAEWNGLLKLASTKPRALPGDNNTSTDHSRSASEASVGGAVDEEVFYESLEEFHVFVLAHVLRRPIIVVADTILKDSNGEALAPIPFGGIYLPLLVSPSVCNTSPLLLTYDAAHFSALVAMDTTDPASGVQSGIQNSFGENAGRINAARACNIHSAIPLVDPDWELLPLHFVVDPGEKYDWQSETPAGHFPDMDAQLAILDQYLDIASLPLPASMAPSPPVTPVTDQVLNGGNGIHRSVSCESEEGKGDKKKNKQLQGVAKSFGSLGKSLGKNFKKMGTLGKDKEKEKKKTDKKNTGTCPLLAVSSTAAANNSSGLSSDVLTDRQHVLCARLMYKRMEYQDEIVRNFLDSAEHRFRSEQVVQKLRKEEQVHHQRMATSNNKPVECINQGCKGKATAVTSYLCKTCFEKQKVVESNRDRSDGEQYSRLDEAVGVASSLGLSPLHINNVAAAGVNSSPAFTRHDTLITTGKSKFYTFPVEEHSASANNKVQLRPHQPTLPFPGINSSPSSSTSLPSAVELSRSSFYDSSLSTQPSYPPPRYVNNLKPTAKSSAVTKKGGAVAQEIQASQALSATFMPSDKQPLRANNVNLLHHPNPDELHPHPMEKTVNKAAVNATSKTLDYSDQLRYPLNVNLNPHECPPHHDNSTRSCRTPNCEFFGTADTDFMCSTCYKRKHSELLRQAEQQAQNKHTNL